MRFRIGAYDIVDLVMAYSHVYAFTHTKKPNNLYESTPEFASDKTMIVFRCDSNDVALHSLSFFTCK